MIAEVASISILRVRARLPWGGAAGGCAAAGGEALVIAENIQLVNKYRMYILWQKPLWGKQEECCDES
jgi:hypothetical protein